MMTPLFIYRRGDPYLVRDLSDQVDKPPEDYKLVASIEGRTWLQSFLNYESKDRQRMLKELKGEGL